MASRSHNPFATPFPNPFATPARSLVSSRPSSAQYSSADSGKEFFEVSQSQKPNHTQFDLDVDLRVLVLWASELSYMSLNQSDIDMISVGTKNHGPPTRKREQIGIVTFSTRVS
jgi:hypothetical protein